MSMAKRLNARVDEAESKGVSRKSLWIFLLIAALMIGGAVAGVCYYNVKSAKDSHARDIATTAALAQLTQLSHGAIYMEYPPYVTSWVEGKVDEDFRVGSCDHVSGYLAMSKRPAPNGAQVHILINGVNPKAPAADMRIVTEDDMLRFKRALASSDSGLAHCVAGDGRLTYYNG